MSGIQSSQDLWDQLDRGSTGLLRVFETMQSKYSPDGRTAAVDPPLSLTAGTPNSRPRHGMLAVPRGHVLRHS